MGVTVRFYRGAWWLFINHQGRRKSKKVGDRATAERIAREVRERLARADLLLAAPPASESFRTYSDAWLTAAAAGLKASTLRFYRDNLENHVWPALGSVPISRLARADVKTLLVVLRSKNLGHRTVTGILRTLSTVLSEAVEDGKLQAIQQFDNERVPVSLGIALDTSGSMIGEKMAAAEAALNRFVFDLLGDQDEMFLYRFDSRPELVQGWTENRQAIRKALGVIKPNGGTAIYDTVA